MSFARIAAVAAAALVAWCATANAGGPLRPFKQGFWSGGAYTDDRTGAFTHCSAGVAYDSGINLFVLVTEGYRWWLGLINPEWELTPNAKVPIKLQLDAGAPIDSLASIPGRQLLLVSLPDSSKLLAAFRRSSRLALDAEGQTFSFKLNGTPVVMDQLASCVRTSLALEAQAQPATPSTAASARSEAEIAPTGAAGSAAAAPPSGSPAATGSGSPAKAAQAARPAAAAKPQTPEASVTASATDRTSTQPPTPPTETATASMKPPPKSGREPASGPPVLDPAPGSAGPAPATARGLAGGATAAPPVSPPVPPPVSTASATDGSPAASGAERDGAGEPPTTSLRAIAPARPAPPAAEKPAATPQPRLPPSASPPLAFTSVAPSAAPSSAIAPEAPPATATAIEEVRLATGFFTKAGLQDGRLVVSDKPPALADFGAVWRSEDAAGAVKIIPPGPDVSGLAIASNLIAVDPQLCKGDFSAARLRTDVDNNVVFSAVLSCSEASEQRVTEYFITPRHQGGFVVFAVIHSKAVGETPGFDWQKIDGLSKAAILAVEGQG